MKREQNPLVEILKHPAVQPVLDRHNWGGMSPRNQIASLSGKTQIDCAIGYVKKAISEEVMSDNDRKELTGLYLSLEKFYPTHFVNGPSSEGPLERKQDGYKACHGY